MTEPDVFATPDGGAFATPPASPPPSSAVARYAGPSIAVGDLINAVISSGVIDRMGLEALLGAERHDPSLNAVETVLIDSNTMSEARLSALLGSLSGIPVVEDQSIKPLPVLPSDVARSTGAIVLDLPQPVVAFVEDLPLNVERVRATLGRADFTVWLVTATHFTELYKAAYKGARQDVRPEVGSLLELFDASIAQGASDIHLTAEHPPGLRINGDLVEMNVQPLSGQWLDAELRRYLGDAAVDIALREHNKDSGFGYGSVRFRINIGADINGLTVAMRQLPSKIPSFDELGLPPAVRHFCDLERGLILVTGPTGSGKSTTLASMLAYIGLNQSRHILTLEDPIEFVIPSRRSIVHQRELGNSFTSFGDGLRQSLRQDPDVILVGEARDRETISAAVTAAETGALVFATLHTYDAVSSLGRIVSTYPEGEQDQIRGQLAYVLKGVVSQTLIPTVTGGRAAAFEVLVSTPAVANNLRKVDGLLQLRQVLSTGAAQGMQTMEAHLAQLVRRGVIREADAEYKARDLEEFRRHLSQGSTVEY